MSLPPRTTSAILLAVLYAGLALMLARAHTENVDARWRDRKVDAHALTLSNREPDPYQYKFFAITWAVEGVHRATGLPLEDLYGANTYLSVLAMLLAHHLWIASLYGRKTGVVGTLLFAAVCHVMFIGYYHHPYEFWGVAGFCLLLAAVEKGRGTATLAPLSLVTGLVWEKHALVPVLWAWKLVRGGAGVLPAAARGVFVLACAVAWPVAVRILCGTDRPAVDVTPLEEQRWSWVGMNHLPLLLPALLVLALRWRQVPPWVRMLWLYVPVLFAAYLANRFILHELRSFWAFVPIVTATLCAWLRVPDAGDDPVTDR